MSRSLIMNVKTTTILVKVTRRWNLHYHKRQWGPRDFWHNDEPLNSRRELWVRNFLTISLSPVNMTVLQLPISCLIGA